MVTTYLANALIITMLVIIAIGFIGLIAGLIRKIYRHVKLIQREKDFEQRLMENRFDHIGLELRAMFDNFVKLDERMKKLEEKKNVKKKKRN